MFIENISAFLPKYGNITKEKFLTVLRHSNRQNFIETKLEKDFLLTLILIKFWESYPDLTFKGGTCLNKIYFPYFRLSEDLDYVIDFELGRLARTALLKRYENDFTESFAEKIRAAFTRKEPAIRDFFDIWFVKRYSEFDFDDVQFRALVRTKLSESEYQYTLDTNYALLQEQIATDLFPVLNDGYDFYFPGIYDFVSSFKA